jgi:hypothetical protein
MVHLLQVLFLLGEAHGSFFLLCSSCGSSTDVVLQDQLLLGLYFLFLQNPQSKDQPNLFYAKERLSTCCYAKQESSQVHEHYERLFVIELQQVLQQTEDCLPNNQT